MFFVENVRAQPICIVVDSLGQDREENADQLAAHRHDSLFALERITLPGRVVVVYLTELGVAPDQRQHCLK